MSKLKDTLILSKMRENIRLELEGYLGYKLIKNDIKELINKIIEIIANASNELEK